jgi:hypothetical protein
VAYTLTQSINWAQAYIEYSPLTAGNNFEPAISIGTMVRNTILNAPVGVWPWNRNEFLISSATPPNLVAGTQDYVFNISDFAYLEKISLLSADGTYGYEIKDIHNTNILGISGVTAGAQAQPDAAAVKFYTPGVSVALRFLSNPDQAYTGTITYQKLSYPFQVFTITAASTAAGGNTTYTGTFNAASFVVGQSAQVAGFVTNASNNGTFVIVSVSATSLVLANSNGIAESNPATAVNESWYPIPDSFMDIFNNLFLAEAMEAVDDARGQYYRQRGMAALLAKSEGLSEMQKNAYLAQWISRGTSQQTAAQLRVQQAQQARGI